jgi:hypothetical protein
VYHEGQAEEGASNVYGSLYCHDICKIMADPLSIAGGIIAVAGLAITSCKALNSLIRGFRNAPTTLTLLEGELNTLVDLLVSLRNALNVPSSTFSPKQEACLSSLKPAIEQCDAMCSTITTKLKKVTSNTCHGTPDWKQKIRLHFNENDLMLLKVALERHKQTLDIAVGMATL